MKSAWKMLQPEYARSWQPAVAFTGIDTDSTVADATVRRASSVPQLSFQTSTLTGPVADSLTVA